MKKLTGKIHLWLGLASGIIVFIVSITGAILAFEHEIKSIIQPYQYSEVQPGKAVLPPSVLREIAEKTMKGQKASGINYDEPGKSATVSFFNRKIRKFQQVYLNPYTGEVLKVWDMDNDFFRFVLNGHFNLWLPRNIGSPIVSYATLIFVVMLITGMVLWWPKKWNKANTDKSFKVKWSAQWRRVNYDLHNVPGFYAMMFALILALSGMMFGIKWFYNSVYWLSSGGSEKVEGRPPMSDTTLINNSHLAVIDRIWVETLKEKTFDATIGLSFPDKASGVVIASINENPGTFYKFRSKYYDQYTGKEITGKALFNGKSEAVKFARMLHNLSYDIHVGAILGLPGKIIAFLASLVSASLPVTGFVIWWGRRKKAKKEGVKKTSSRESMQVKRIRPAVKSKVPVLSK